MRQRWFGWALSAVLCGGLVLGTRSEDARAAPGKVIKVRTAAQLVAAIGSNRTIRVLPGSYRLDSVARTNTKHIKWTRVYDGYQLNVHGVRNLKIIGSGKGGRAGLGGRGRSTLLVKARYAWVLRFVKSGNVTLDNLVLGHTRAGYCVGGVVAFERSKNVKILRSELYGSGTHGLQLERVSKFLMDRSTIRDCTYGIMIVKRSKGVVFKRSRFADNREFDLIHITRTPRVRFERCTVENNRTGSGGGYALFKLDHRSRVTIVRGTYRNNRIDTFVSKPKRLKVIGSAALKRSIKRVLKRLDPRLNMIYRVTRYRKWVVTGGQGGIVFWDVAKGKVVLARKEFISSTFLVKGKYLWAGTYSKVLRFDGTRVKTYRSAKNVRGHAVFSGPKGGVMVRQKSNYWRYDPKRDRLATVSPTWAPSSTPYDLLVRKNGEIWSLRFMSSIFRRKAGVTTRIRLRSTRYSGKDPRRFYEASNGQLWVSDFDNGFFQWDPRHDAFTWDPTITQKASDLAVDVKRKRTWLGHYTRGVYLKRPGKATKFFNFASLKYMRALYLDTKSGDLWIGGWNALVRLYRSGNKWKRQRFVAR